MVGACAESTVSSHKGKLENLCMGAGKGSGDALQTTQVLFCGGKTRVSGTV